MIVGYSRASTDTQTKNGSIERQKILIDEFALDEHLQIDKHIQDTGSALKYGNQPNLYKFINNDCNKGSTVLAYNINRVFQTRSEGFNILDVLREKNITVMTKLPHTIIYPSTPLREKKQIVSNAIYHITTTLGQLADSRKLSKRKRELEHVIIKEPAKKRKICHVKKIQNKKINPIVTKAIYRIVSEARRSKPSYKKIELMLNKLSPLDEKYDLKKNI